MSAASTAPPGTFAPGTKVQVGSHRVLIERYLSEGGFAHVYVVRVPAPDDTAKHSIAVLKRVAVPDKDALANMRTEVETMKKLQGHKHIVTYMDSHASQLKGGGYEVFLLMEFCSGGGLIDFMNTRLQNRLTEPEILHIFGDVSEGLATMHYLRPPLLHRDLKVENVLITKSTKGMVYKLCDFGSTAPPRPAATNAQEGRLIEDDIQRHTTMQYRSPEMVDVWRRQPIDEKSDIWALGVLLYKLCYYTTPFEEVGQMAILNASFKFPHYPPFSDRLKRLITSLLREDPRQRPNIYQVISEVCSMRGMPVPIKDIYAERTQSEARSTQQLPSVASPMASPPLPGLSHASPIKQKQFVPDIAPMRRGRPTGPAQQPIAAKPAAPPAQGDPFAALDSSSLTVRANAVDELSNKFPSLDEFSIAHEHGQGFQFMPLQGNAPNDDVAKALADEAFAQAQPQSAPRPKSVAMEHPAQSSRTQSMKTQSTMPDERATLPPRSDSLKTQPENLSSKPLLHQPVPTRPSSRPSTTNMTAPSPIQTTKPLPKLPDLSKRPIWRVPETSGPTSQPRASPTAQADANRLQPSAPPTQRPALLDAHRSKSQTATMAVSKSPISSRPSLEGHRTSSFGLDEGIVRARSANPRQRPVSAAFVDSNLDYLREQEKESALSWKRPSLEIRRSSRSIKGAETGFEETNIESDADYLRSLEGREALARKNSAKDDATHKKRSSLSHMIAGRFGDAFKRFEQTGEARVERGKNSPQFAPRTPSPEAAPQTEHILLSPVAGSEMTASPPRASQNEYLLDLEQEEVPPEMRREMERLQLNQEEKRVAAAAAEYRKRAGGAPPVPSKANMIQQRVQSLLVEGQKSPVYKKTAEGYGHFTERRAEDVERQAPPPQMQQPVAKKVPPPVSKKPSTGLQSAPPGSVDMNLKYHKVRQPSNVGVPNRDTTAAAAATVNRTGPRPNAPCKPAVLRKEMSGVSGMSTGGRRLSSPRSPGNEDTNQRNSGGGLAALLARDQEGVASPGAGTSDQLASPKEVNAYREADMGDWEADFSKRYPSLSGIEMVEREIAAGGMEGSRQSSQRSMRIRDV